MHDLKRAGGAGLDASNAPPVLPGTQPLTREGDLGELQAQAMEAYLAERVEQVARQRRHITSALARGERASCAAELTARRGRFRQLLALSEKRWPPKPAVEPLSETEGLQIVRLQWPLAHCGGNGSADAPYTVAALMLEAGGDGPKPAGILLPDESQLPEDLAGLTEALPPAQQIARRLAEAGVVVLCPYLVAREYVGRSLGEPGDYLNWRRRLWKLSTQVGRTLIGFEVDRTLACVDYLWARPDVRKEALAVGGLGQGGLTAFYAAACDERIAVAVVGDYFGPREGVWREPVDRALWGQLVEFGDAEIAGLIAPRRWVVVPGAQTPDRAAVQAEFDRALLLFRRLGAGEQGVLDTGDGAVALRLLTQLCRSLGLTEPPVPATPFPRISDGASVRASQRDEIEAWCQRMVAASERQRQVRWAGGNADPRSAFEQTQQSHRETLAQMLGLSLFPRPDAPLEAESRLLYDEPEFRSYEVVIPVYEKVFLYGVLTVPKGWETHGRCPAIVCQHGAGGHPRYDILGLEPGGTPDIYHRIGAEHAARGYVTFAPQGHFRFMRGLLQDLYRRAFSIGGTDFGLFVRMHQRAVEWLRTLPFVDGERIGFHGLSYGGYTALWVSPLAPEYQVVVCAGHFNDWAAKTTDPEASTSYLWHNDDEMYNFDMLNCFNHSDLVALIYPRPFLAEMGREDAVTPPAWVNREYAKVVQLYKQQGFPERTEIHWGQGGHQIFAERSYPFLDRWLRGAEP